MREEAVGESLGPGAEEVDAPRGREEVEEVRERVETSMRNG